MIIEFGRILACLAVGDVLSRIVPVPLPASVLGLLVLFGWLYRRGSVPTCLNAIADQTLDLFGLLFVPAGVGVIAYKHSITSDSLAVAMTISAGTLITICVAAIVASWIASFDGKERRT